MQFNDRLIGLFSILGGVAVILGTLAFRAIPGQEYGSAFFPRIVGGALILTGLALAIKGGGVRFARLSDMARGLSGLRVAAVLGAVILWVYLAPVLGFIPATTLLICGLALIAGGRILPAAITAAVMAVVLFVVFSVLLRVPLPLGPLEVLLS